MSEHYCKDCGNGSVNSVCSLTGATHTTGIECPSFGPKESEMFKVGDRVRVIAVGETLIDRYINVRFSGVAGEISEILDSHNEINGVACPYRIDTDHDTFRLAAQDLELVEEEVKEPHGGEPEYDPDDGPPIRTFGSGATRDTDRGKLDYEAILSPLSLERYVVYMNKHRVQSDGSLREGDNWQKGIPITQYMKSKWRHIMDTWRIHRGWLRLKTYVGLSTDDIQESLCGELFNTLGMLHEVIKLERDAESDRTAPTERVHIGEKW